jgi:hypothetical protein
MGCTWKRKRLLREAIVSFPGKQTEKRKIQLENSEREREREREREGEGMVVTKMGFGALREIINI